MSSLHQCEFFLLRYVPDAVKDEFVNVGVVLVETNGAFAGTRFARDYSRVQCLDPGADLDLLAALEHEFAARLRDAGEDREKLLKTIQDSFSNLIQITGTKAVLTADPARELETLSRMYLETGPGRRAPRATGRAGRPRLYAAMRDAFETAGVWTALTKDIPAAEYTRPGDPLKIDCGYRPNGIIKMFHAVALSTDANSGKLLALSYPEIEAGLHRRGLKGELTAIIEDQLDESAEHISFALATMREKKLRLAPERELPSLARRIRDELAL